jgi:hypothetical protein
MGDKMGQFVSPYWVNQTEEPRFKTSGALTAWIAGSLWSPSSGSSGVSACAWLVARVDQSERPVRDKRPSEAFDSDDYRATVAAALRAAQIVPSGSHLRLLTGHKVVAEAIERDMYRWEKEGWKDGRHKRNGWEFYEALVRLINDRSLKVIAAWQDTGRNQIVELRREAHRCARRAGEVMGIRPGARLPFRKGQVMSIVNIPPEAPEP